MRCEGRTDLFRSPPGSPADQGEDAPDGPLLIDGRTAAKLLNISERTLQTLASSGAVPSRKLRNLRRYVPSELAQWVADGCPSHPRDSGAGEEGSER